MSLIQEALKRQQEEGDSKPKVMQGAVPPEQPGKLSMQKEILPGISAVSPTMSSTHQGNAVPPPPIPAPPVMPEKKASKAEPEKFSAPSAQPIIKSTKTPPDKKKPMLIAVLVVLLIFVGLKLLRKSDDNPEPVSQQAVETTDVETGTVKETIQEKEQVLIPEPNPATTVAKTEETPPPETKDSGAGEAVTTAEEAVEWPPLSLTAVMGKGTKGSARINGELLGVGDEIEGVIFKAVGNNGVYLEYKGKTKFLKRGQTVY